MEKELNPELKASVMTRFEELFKLIGPNRQQLTTKVYAVQHELLKEIAKAKIDAKRQGEIMFEISRTEKMAHQQLPLQLQRPTAAAKPKTASAPKAKAPKAEKKPKEKPAPKAKAAAAPKKAAPKKKKK